MDIKRQTKKVKKTIEVDEEVVTITLTEEEAAVLKYVAGYNGTVSEAVGKAGPTGKPPHPTTGAINVLLCDLWSKLQH